MYLQLFDFLPQDVGPFESAGQIGIGHHRRKLLTSVSTRNVLAASILDQEISEGTQERIPCLVAERIVKRFEVVEIHHDDRHGAFVAIGSTDLSLQRILHVTAIE